MILVEFRVTLHVISSPFPKKTNNLNVSLLFKVLLLTSMEKSDSFSGTRRTWIVVKGSSTFGYNSRFQHLQVTLMLELPDEAKV